MTENEAIKHLKLCKTSRLFIPNNDVLEIAIQALEEIQAYRAIGTIDEFKALKEKKSEWKYSKKENLATCKNCSYEHYLGTYHQYATNYCPNCGSKMTET